MADLLHFYGVTGADFARYAAPQAPAAEREAILLRTLYHLPRITPAEWDKWGQASPALEQVAAAPDSYRAAAVHVDGYCRRLEQRSVPAALQESLEFRAYYELEIEAGSVPGALQVFVREVPASWKTGTLNHRVTVDGVLLDAVNTSAGRRLILAAPRVAWFPATASPALGIGSAQLELAKRGVDFSRIEEARLHNGREFDNNDRELFYQLLAAVRELDTTHLAGAEPLRIEALLTDPAPRQGRLLRFVAQARRITPIRVEDPDIRARYGIDRYYQVDAMLLLEDRQIRLELPHSEQSALYSDKFPFTFCAVRLPESLHAALQPEPDESGERPLMNERVELSGFFLKLWPYGSDYLQALDERQKHPSPLFLGTTVTLAPLAPPPRDTPLGIGLAVSFAIVLLLAVAVLWRTNRQQQARLRALRRERTAPMP